MFTDKSKVLYRYSSFFYNFVLFICLEGDQQEEESYLDYASVADQLETKITVRYGNSTMEEGETFVCSKHFLYFLLKFNLFINIFR
jgi:hypothetical protein